MNFSKVLELIILLDLRTPIFDMWFGAASRMDVKRTYVYYKRVDCVLKIW